MGSQAGPEVILYDIPGVKGECWSANVWRIRIMLNYKQIPYKTQWLEIPDIESTLKPL
jgi:hypothetical protein